MLNTMAGVLSQGGKYVWERYATQYVATAGTTVTATKTPSYTKMAASAYTMSNGVFTLTNPVSVSYEELQTGYYLVDASDSSSTTVSGGTLYSVDNKTVSASVTLSPSSGGTFYETYDSGTSIKVSRTVSVVLVSGVPHIKFTGSTTTIDKLNGVWLYSTNKRHPTGMYSTGTVRSGYAYRFTKSSSSDSYTIHANIYECYPTVNSLSMTYTPYTAALGKGSLIDTVESEDPSAYPENGIQNGYWYVLVT